MAYLAAPGTLSHSSVTAPSRAEEAEGLGLVVFGVAVTKSELVNLDHLPPT